MCGCSTSVLLILSTLVSEWYPLALHSAIEKCEFTDFWCWFKCRAEILAQHSSIFYVMLQRMSLLSPICLIVILCSCRKCNFNVWRSESSVSHGLALFCLSSTSVASPGGSSETSLIAVSVSWRVTVDSHCLALESSSFRSGFRGFQSTWGAGGSFHPCPAATASLRWLCLFHFLAIFLLVWMPDKYTSLWGLRTDDLCWCLGSSLSIFPGLALSSGVLKADYPSEDCVPIEHLSLLHSKPTSIV